MTTINQEQMKPASLQEKNSIWRKNKLRTAVMFFALGLVGLVLPVIPGLLFIGYAFWLVFPAPVEKIWRKLRGATSQ